MAHARSGFGRPGTALLLALLAASGAQAAESVGSVAALEGSADVQHPGQTARVPLHPADGVLLDDALRTGDASKMKLLFRDDSVLTLAAGSELTVTREIVGPASATATHDVIGTVRAVVTDRYKTPGSSFEVETPTAIAGVRGTGFIVRYEPAKKGKVRACRIVGTVYDVGSFAFGVLGNVEGLFHVFVVADSLEFVPAFQYADGETETDPPDAQRRCHVYIAGHRTA